MTASDMPADLVGVSHLSFTVPDLAASVAWYERVLGLERLGDEQHADGSRFQLLVHPGSGFALGLRQHDAGDGSRFDERRTGMDHFALLVASREELDAWADRFDELGVEHSPVAGTDYGDVLVFRDPDNIQLELFFSPLQVQLMRPGA